MNHFLHPGQTDDGTGCPNCMSDRWDEIEQYCSWCGYEPEYEDDEPPPEHNHTGFYVHTEHGPAHVLGDPNMSAETMNALLAMIKAAQDMMANEDDQP